MQHPVEASWARGSSCWAIDRSSFPSPVSTNSRPPYGEPPNRSVSRIDDRSSVERAADLPVAVPPETTNELTNRLADDLVGFQSSAYARRFRMIIGSTLHAERAVTGDLTDGDRFTRAVAVHLHKLMAYKDEYEVARLLLDDDATSGYEAIGGAGTQVTYHLHPPMLRALGMDRKLKLEKSAPTALKALRKGKRLRGTVADPFRWAEVRKLEREMIPEYIDAVEQLTARLTKENIGEAIEIASLPDSVRGYEDLKVRRAKAYRSELADRLRRWN